MEHGDQSEQIMSQLQQLDDTVPSQLSSEYEEVSVDVEDVDKQ